MISTSVIREWRGTCALGESWLERGLKAREINGTARADSLRAGNFPTSHCPSWAGCAGWTKGRAMGAWVGRDCVCTEPCEGHRGGLPTAAKPMAPIGGGSVMMAVAVKGEGQAHLLLPWKEAHNNHE